MRPAPARPRAFVIGVITAVLAGLVALGVEINHVAGFNSEVAVNGALAATPTPTPTPTPSASAAPVATPTPCHGKTFSSTPLPPFNPPANVHVYSAPPQSQIDPSKLYEARIDTVRGSIVLCLEPQLAPNTVNNFVALARNHFYDGLTFHRVEPGFVIQGGDPQGNGSGGPGYKFSDEPVRGAYTAGCVAMANSGPNTNGSQFFICTADDTSKLAKSYNLFGYVETGFASALLIQKGDVMQSVTVLVQQ